MNPTQYQYKFWNVAFRDGHTNLQGCYFPVGKLYHNPYDKKTLMLGLGNMAGICSTKLPKDAQLFEIFKP